jgi:glycosyltransferase involved in cell wall biosynthesis
MKILIAADTYFPHVNGASYFTQRLAFYLQQRGHRVLVIAPSRTFKNEFYTHETPIQGIRSIPVLIHKDFRVSLPILLGSTVENVIAAYAPEIVHVQGHFFIQTGARLLQQIGFKKEVLPISCGIDRSRFCPSANGNGLRKKYSLPEGKKILLYVGRVDREKNIDLILRGLSRVVRTSNVHLVIAGRGAEENRLKRLERSLGLHERVTFAGFVPDADLPGFYAMADCFIIAGTAELQSIVTLEAMASGLPVIGVRAMALPELVHPGANGCLFYPGDESGVADCITAVFADASRRKEMSAGSLAIIERHDIEQTINQFESIYRSLVAKKNSK